jgi:hypothetical protein
LALSKVEQRPFTEQYTDIFIHCSLSLRNGRYFHAAFDSPVGAAGIRLPTLPNRHYNLSELGRYVLWFFLVSVQVIVINAPNVTHRLNIVLVLLDVLSRC